METDDYKNDAFISFIKKEYCKYDRTNNRNIIVKRVDLTDPDSAKEDVIQAHLKELEASGKGLFMQRHQNRSTTQLFCQRHGKPKGKARGPESTRANRCPAYVSFRFVTHKDKSAVIIREHIQHEGHDLENPLEKHVSLPDPSLVNFIEHLLEQGKKTKEVIVEAWKWARNHGHCNFHDRRFYLTPVDVKNIAQSYRAKPKEERLQVKEGAAEQEICTDSTTEEIIFCQEQDEQKKQPLVVVFQNKQQREKMRKHATEVVFIDAAYKGQTSHGYHVMYTLLLRNELGHGIPLAHCISSEDSSQLVYVFLECVKAKALASDLTFQPSAVMVERDVAVIRAVRNSFPESTVLLCWYKVLQTVYKFLNEEESGLLGDEMKGKVIKHLRKMKACKKEEEFHEMVENLPQQMPSTEVTRYLEDNWCKASGDIDWPAMWSDYGRTFLLEGNKTCDHIEKFFLHRKGMAKGHGKTRLEDLLSILHGNVTDFTGYMEEMEKAGRIRRKRESDDTVEILLEENAVTPGIQYNITWKSKTECDISAQSDPGKEYTVNLITATCSCHNDKGMCDHVHLIQQASKLCGVDEDIVIAERKAAATSGVQSGNYHYDPDKELMEVYHANGDIGIVDTVSLSCTCAAFSLGIEKCVCVLEAKLVLERLTARRRIIKKRVSLRQRTKRCGVTTKIREKVKDIEAIVTSENFINVPNKQLILKQVETLHSLLQESCPVQQVKKQVKRIKSSDSTQIQNTSHTDYSDHSYHMNKDS